MNLRLLFSILFVAFLNALVGQVSLWDQLFEEGAYEVGFKAIYTYDDLSSFQMKDSPEFRDDRPLRIFYWYPSRTEARGAKALSIQDYLNVSTEDPKYASYARFLNQNDQASLKRKIFIEEGQEDPTEQIL
ncbi:MAG: hypothetical protein AAF696_36205, partial [Bacteroidota bacterium]